MSSRQPQPPPAKRSDSGVGNQYRKPDSAGKGSASSPSGRRPANDEPADTRNHGVHKLYNDDTHVPRPEYDRVLSENRRLKSSLDLLNSHTKHEDLVANAPPPMKATNKSRGPRVDTSNSGLLDVRDDDDEIPIEEYDRVCDENKRLREMLKMMDQHTKEAPSMKNPPRSTGGRDARDDNRRSTNADGGRGGGRDDRGGGRGGNDRDSFRRDDSGSDDDRGRGGNGGRGGGRDDNRRDDNRRDDNRRDDDRRASSGPVRSDSRTDNSRDSRGGGGGRDDSRSGGGGGRGGDSDGRRALSPQAGGGGGRQSSSTASATRGGAARQHVHTANTGVQQVYSNDRDVPREEYDRVVAKNQRLQEMLKLMDSHTKTDAAPPADSRDSRRGGSSKDTPAAKPAASSGGRSGGKPPSTSNSGADSVPKTGDVTKAQYDRIVSDNRRLERLLDTMNSHTKVTPLQAPPPKKGSVQSPVPTRPRGSKVETHNSAVTTVGAEDTHVPKSEYDRVKDEVTRLKGMVDKLNFHSKAASAPAAAAAGGAAAKAAPGAPAAASSGASASASAGSSVVAPSDGTATITVKVAPKSKFRSLFEHHSSKDKDDGRASSSAAGGSSSKSKDPAPAKR